MADSDKPIIVGRIIIPSRMDAVIILFPVPPKMLRVMGTNTTSPKKPYTIEGIPAIKFTAGFKYLYNFFGQNFARYIAVNIPIGTPIIIAPIVT